MIRDDITPPFPDRRSKGLGSPGYHVREVTREWGPAWEISGECEGVRAWIADCGTEADARWIAGVMTEAYAAAATARADGRR